MTAKATHRYARRSRRKHHGVNARSRHSDIEAKFKNARLQRPEAAKEMQQITSLHSDRPPGAMNQMQQGWITRVMGAGPPDQRDHVAEILNVGT